MNVEERLKILQEINELLGRQKSFSRFSTKEEGKEFARLCALIEDGDYLLKVPPRDIVCVIKTNFVQVI